MLDECLVVKQGGDTASQSVVFGTCRHLAQRGRLSNGIVFPLALQAFRFRALWNESSEAANPEIQAAPVERQRLPLKPVSSRRVSGDPSNLTDSSRNYELINHK